MGRDKMAVAQQLRVEWSGVETRGGFAYLWFCSSSALVHLYSRPPPTQKAQGRRFKCVKALCVQDELELQTHTILWLYHSVVASLTLQPSLASPAVWALFLFRTLLISTLSNILPHFLQISSPPSLRYGSGIQEWLVGTLGIVAGGNNCDGCRVCQSSEPWHRYVGCQGEIFEVHLNCAKFLSAGGTCVGVCTYVHVYLCDKMCALTPQDVATVELLQ